MAAMGEVASAPVGFDQWRRDALEEAGCRRNVTLKHL